MIRWPLEEKWRAKEWSCVLFSSPGTHLNERSSWLQEELQVSIAYRLRFNMPNIYDAAI